jgi:membrane protein
MTETPPSRPRRAWTFILRLERRFTGDDALNRAAALSYTTLLSLVPLLAIGLAILAAFPAFETARIQLRRFMIGNLVPEVGEQVRQSIDGFISNAGNLTAIGITGLVVTSVLLLYTIEDAMNRIFRVTKTRTPMSRLVVYWTVLTLGPILLGASLTISDWLFTAPADSPILAYLVGLGAALFHFAMLVALFILLYAAMPARYVPLRQAAIGAASAAVGIALLRLGFHIYVVDLHAYQSIYGALAAIPIMLFWMYLIWAVVLAGAELTACLLEDIEKAKAAVSPSLPSSEHRKDASIPTS